MKNNLSNQDTHEKNVKEKRIDQTKKYLEENKIFIEII